MLKSSFHRYEAFTEQFNYGAREGTHLVRTKPDGAREMALAITWKDIQDGDTVEGQGGPLFCDRIGDHRAFLQALMDVGWELGLRPLGFQSEQELHAVKGHLADMRRLIFGQKPDEIRDR